MTHTDFELLQMQVEALFVHDDRSHLLSINEPDPENPAPRFFLGRSSGGNLWRVRYDLPDVLVDELERLAASEPVDGELNEPPYHQLTYMELLAAHAPIHEAWGGPAYHLPRYESPTGAVVVTAENRDVLQPHFPWLHDNLEGLSPAAVVIADGVAVTECSSVRLTPKAAEAGLYTEEPYRGRGFGEVAVRVWAEAVRATGRIPLYSTSWENTASQAVAKKLDAVLYGSDFSIT